MPLLLLYGDNDVDIDGEVGATRQTFDNADISTFDGKDVAFATLAEACATAGLFNPQRLIMVRDLHERLKATGRSKKDSKPEEISSIFQGISPSTTLLLVSRNITAENQLVRLVREAGGNARFFQAPKKYELSGWIAKRANHHDIRINREAAEVLAELIGANLLMLDSELSKLAMYALDEEPVTASTVESLVGSIPQASIFALVDAIATGDRAGALDLLQAHLDQASGTATDFALYLIRMLARQMRILLQIRLGQEEGKSTGALTTQLKLPRYYADRYFKQSKRLSVERLRLTFEHLAALEYSLKSSQVDPVASLTLVVSKLCG